MTTRVVPAAGTRARALATSPWGLAAGVAVVALATLLTNAPGVYIGDNRFEFFWAPADLLVRHLGIWEPSRGLGRMRWDFWPATTGYLAALRGLGLSPDLAERVWHATLVASGGIGAAFLLRTWRPRIGVEHWAAAFLYAFGPFSALFLLPSNLYLGYVLAPWLLLAFLAGVTGERPWRWAAVFALLVFLPGNMNYPALVFAVLPVAPAAVFVVVVERRATWRTVASWVLRAAALTILVSAAALVTTSYSSTINRENLLVTETPNDIARASSWSESWRGFGFWLAYWVDSRGIVLPQFGRYFWAPVVGATFVAPALALAAIWRSTWRPRLLFAVTLVLGLTFMVGAYPVGRSSPFGRTVLWAYEQVPGVLALRSGHKAGAMVALSVAILAAVAIAWFVTWVVSSGRIVGVLALLALAGLLGAACFPFWAGRLYGPKDGAAAIPDYWEQAFDWLDAQPGDGRVLVLPSTVDGLYRWGNTGGDDILEAHIGRGVVARGQLATWQGTEEAANAIASLDDYVNGGQYEAGVIGPIAQRLGIRWVLIRNDLQWRPLFRPRPRVLQPLRADPDLRRVAAFGDPGENVVEPGRPSRVEATLPPVEVFEVETFDGLARATTAPPLVVVGDGNAWPGLAAGGLFDDTGGVRYAAAASDQELVRLLRAGSAVVVTDTNRRRVNKIPLRDSTGRGGPTQVRTSSTTERHRALFPSVLEQSVASFGDARRVSGSDYGLPQLPQAQFRPANAFDDDLATAWRVSPLNVRPHFVTAELRTPRVLTSVEVVGAPGRPTARFPVPFRVTQVSVELSDGTRVVADLVGDRATVELPPVRTSSVTVRIEAVEGAGLREFGLAEVAVEGVDLRERTDLPTSIARRAARSRSVRDALAAAPVLYQFSRLGRVDSQVVERAIRRRFQVVDARDFEVSGRLDRDERSPDPTVEALVADAASGTSTCHDIGLTVDGTVVPVRVDAEATKRVGPTEGQGPLGSVVVVGCERIDLDAGLHELLTEPGPAVRQVWLATGRPTSAPPLPVDTRTRGRTTVDLEVQAADDTWLMAGFSSEPSWRASIAGGEDRRPTTLDAQAAWRIDETGTVSVEMRTTAQTVYAGALVVTILALVACVVLVVRGRLR